MDNWIIKETEFDPKTLHHKEAVFTIGNGYLSTRGAFEEGYPKEASSTLIHGVFDDIPVVYTELVNTPNWINLVLFVDGERFRLDRGKLLDYRRELHLENGVLVRRVRWESPQGRIVDLSFERFASLHDPHLLGLRCQIEAVNFSGEIEVQAAIPGHVDNEGWLHWRWRDQGALENRSAYLCLETKVTEIGLCQAAHLELEAPQAVEYAYWNSQWTPTLVARTHLDRGQSASVEKLAAVYTSRDQPDFSEAAQQSILFAAEEGFSALLEKNTQAWKREWEYCNITITGDDPADRALRYSLFQLLIAAPREDHRVSIGAKALSGFGYRGHVFWDTEIFILPFFTYTRPEIARNLLMYRYHTLPGARQKARSIGYEGAMYAWESAATGEETTPRWIPGPQGEELVRIWTGDIEHHISADIAYAVIQYWQVTGDDAFLRDYGAEIVLDTARFWGSRAEWDPDRAVYEFTDVIGPDEYHDHVDNNAYTNVMARWNIQAAFEVLEWLRKEYPDRAVALEIELDLNEDRLAHWREVIQRTYIPYDPDTGLFEQFDGFFDLKDVDLQDYEPRSKSLQVVLGLKGVQEYQIIKQPDVLMMLFLLRDEFSQEVIEANWDYYTPRTDLTYGSSLGPATQATLAARMGEVDRAYHYFMHASRTDLEDVRGNAGHGIHAATAGGLWQAAVLGFGGVEERDGQLLAHPCLPAHWEDLRFRIVYRGREYQFDLRPDQQPPVAPSLVGTGETEQEKLRLLGAIFDLDGVLTDTSEMHFLAWKRLADEEGISFNREDNEALRGVSRRESLIRLLDGREYPEEKIHEMMDRKNRYYQEMIAGLTPENLLPGALSLLESLKIQGVKIAIGSASKNAQAVIEKLGIANLVDAVSDGHSVRRQKPEPDLFLHAAGQLGLLPSECVVFEDAEAGVAAALSGGFWTVGIGPEERVGEAHLVLPDLADVTWEELVARIHNKFMAPKSG